MKGKGEDAYDYQFKTKYNKFNWYVIKNHMFPGILYFEKYFENITV